MNEIFDRVKDELYEDGVATIDGFFTDDELQPAIDELCIGIDRASSKLVRQGLLKNAWKDEGFETRLSHISEESESLLISVARGELSGPALFNLMVHPRLLNLIERVVGPEIIASAAWRVRPKVPHHVRGVQPWHQDSAYYEPWCDNQLILGCWIPLVDATLDRGCLLVMPKMHQNGVFRHWHREENAPYIEIHPASLPKGKVRPLPIKKGGLVLMTNTTPHCSGDNVSDVIRWSVDFRYQGAYNLPTNFQTSSGQVWRESVKEGEPPACFPPGRDTLVRSSKSSAEVITDWEEFYQLHRSHKMLRVKDRWNIGW